MLNTFETALRKGQSGETCPVKLNLLTSPSRYTVSEKVSSKFAFFKSPVSLYAYFYSAFVSLSTVEVIKCLCECLLTVFDSEHFLFFYIHRFLYETCVFKLFMETPA